MSGRWKNVAPQVVNNVFRAVITLALENRPASDNNLAELVEISTTQIGAAIRALKEGGKISLGPPGKARQATILVGEHAGLTTPELKRFTKKEREAARRAAQGPEAPIPDSHCAWCGKNIGKAEYGKSYCGTKCAFAFNRHGLHSQAEVEAMLRRPPGPRGCRTVEEWIEKGGQIYRAEPSSWPVGGVPVKERGNPLLGGRVR